MNRILSTCLCALILSAPAQAQGLIGRTLSFHIATYDDPAAPLYESRRHEAVVGDGPEFGLDEEGRKEGFDLIPVGIDVSADRVVIDYAQADPGEIYKARFNGYVLDFGPGCPAPESAQLSEGDTTLPIGNKRLRVEDGVLLVNVSNLRFDRSSRIVIDLTLSDCPQG